MDHVRGKHLDAGLHHIKRLAIHPRCHPRGLSQDELLVYEPKEYIDHSKSQRNQCEEVGRPLLSRYIITFLLIVLLSKKPL